MVTDIEYQDVLQLLLLFITAVSARVALCFQCKTMLLLSLTSLVSKDCRQKAIGLRHLLVSTNWVKCGPQY